MYDKIMVPLDGSNLAESALKHAEILAQTFGARLILVSVVRPPTLVGHDSNELHMFHQNLEQLTKETETYLAGLIGGFREKGIQAEMRVIVGSVVKEIAGAAESENVDLLIIASHGRSGLGRVFYGSVAAGLLNRIERPLMIIRAA